MFNAFSKERMRPEQEHYILENISRKSTQAIAKELGLKERKIKRYLQKRSAKHSSQTNREPAHPSSSRSHIILSIILIALVGFAVYANSLNGAFIWDDGHLVEDNLYIRDWAMVPRFFTEGMAAGSDAPTLYSFYRPLQLISYTLDHSVWSLDPRGYHLTNVILHILAALSVFWLVRVLFHDLRLALFTSLLFVVHPVHTEAVSYISGRAEPLVVIFLMTSFVYHIKTLTQGKPRHYLLMISCYILAVLSKELSLVFPFLLLLYHYTFRRPVRWKAYLPILAIAFSYVTARYTVLSFLFSHAEHPSTFTAASASRYLA